MMTRHPGFLLAVALLAGAAGAAGTTPEQFAEIIRRDLARWRKVIARANIKAE
jgi:hypothetical protein